LLFDGQDLPVRVVAASVNETLMDVAVRSDRYVLF
jgi:hypothetical protein